MLESDEDIKKLISCKKFIIKAPHAIMKDDGYKLRNELDLSSEDKENLFHVYIRQNKKFPENFSGFFNFAPGQ